MKRAAVSVPSNIAEGAAGGSAKSFHNYQVQADGSLAGLDTQFEWARRLGFATEEEISDAEALLDETSALVGGLQRSQRVSE
jgi:four helix bundle protein